MFGELVDPSIISESAMKFAFGLNRLPAGMGGVRRPLKCQGKFRQLRIWTTS